ncbi:hypothetical protein KPATCC21470_5937 [Kitasatospora purpeofusca]
MPRFLSRSVAVTAGRVTSPPAEGVVWSRYRTHTERGERQLTPPGRNFSHADTS